jgi:hypothetical protein
MSTTTVAAERRTELAASVSRLVDTARGYLAARLGAAMTAVKEDVSDPDGMLPGAAVGVVEAERSRTNPVWAAAKGAWSGADAKSRVLLVAALVLTLLLAPVVLAVGLVGILVAAVVNSIRKAAGST